MYESTNNKDLRKQATELKKLFKAIAVKGDQVALEELFYNFSGRINAYAKTLLIEKDSADDVTTELFVKIAYLNSLECIDNPLGWMFKVTKNLCSDYNRKVKYTEDMDSAGANLTAMASTDFDRELALLPAMQKEIVLLEVVGNMSQRDIAAHLNITRAEVRKERELAINKLQKVFLKESKR